MKIAVLGTGMVGRAHAGRLTELGHDVVIGTNDVKKTLAKDTPDAMGNAPFKEWQKDHLRIKLESFENAAKHAEIIFAALHGQIAVETLKSISESVVDKVLIDITNPLDFSKGMPPTLFVSNTDSLGEQIQKALPKSKVVKAFNTTNAYLQVNPNLLAKGDHTLFICGNDSHAKEKVKEIAESYGWMQIMDLGDITASRGMEMLMPFWLRAWGVLNSPMFNYKIVTGDKK